MSRENANSSSRPDENGNYKTWLVISPDLTASGLITESHFVHLPAEITKRDLGLAWESHRQSGGRVSIAGGETLDHDTRRFEDVLTDLGAVAMTVEEVMARPSVKVAVLKQPKLKNM